MCIDGVVVATFNCPPSTPYYNPMYGICTHILEDSYLDSETVETYLGDQFFGFYTKLNYVHFNKANIGDNLDWPIFVSKSGPIKCLQYSLNAKHFTKHKCENARHFENVDDFEKYIKEMQKLHSKQKSCNKNFLGILMGIESESERRDSVKKWVKEGIYTVIAADKNGYRKISADSIDDYYATKPLK